MRKLFFITLSFLFSCSIGVSAEVFDSKFFSVDMPNDWIYQNLSGNSESIISVVFQKGTADHVSASAIVVAASSVVDPAFYLTNQIVSNEILHNAKSENIVDCLFKGYPAKKLSTNYDSFDVNAYCFNNGSITYFLIDFRVTKFQQGEFGEILQNFTIKDIVVEPLTLEERLVELVNSTKTILQNANYDFTKDNIYLVDIMADTDRHIMTYDYKAVGYQVENNQQAKSLLLDALFQEKSNELIMLLMKAGYIFRYRYLNPDRTIVEISILPEDYQSEM